MGPRRGSCSEAEVNFKNCSAECCPNRDLPEEKLIILITIRSLVIIFAILGNTLMFKAFHSFSSLRTASNVIVVGLCAADSLIAIVYILNISKTSLKLSFNDEHKSKGICEASAWFSFILISVIILHLALISFERLIAVKFPLRYHAIVTNRRALFSSIAVWLWAVAVTLVFPQALRVNNNDAYNRLVRALHPCLKTTKTGRPDGPAPPLSTGYLIFLVSSTLLIPLMIILCSYSYIFIVSHKHRKQIRVQGDIQGITTMKREMRGARTLAIVAAVCLLSIVPLLICTILGFFDKLPANRPQRRMMRYIVYDIAFGLNAICNPLIYGWRNEQYRNAFRRLLKCC